MKINSYPLVNPLFGKIAETNRDKQGGSGSNAYEQQKKQDPSDSDSKKEARPEEVEAAVVGFDGDVAHQEHGITASTEGNGPGLRVVLKDARGGVLRSVSGEEFLKLREAAATGAKSGRILDQKA